MYACVHTRELCVGTPGTGRKMDTKMASSRIMYFFYTPAGYMGFFTEIIC